MHHNATEVDLVRDALRLPSHLLRGQQQRVRQQRQVSCKSKKQQRQQEKAKKAAAETLEA